VYLLDSPIKDYPWGSRTAIAELMGRPAPTPKPEAELWMGAHPSAPSRVLLPTGPEPLDQVIQRDPSTALGARVLARFGPRLPFLLKVLAAARPLSLQAHPSAAQAAAGYAREDGLGVPLDAPHRSYRDASHKPELLVALGRFRALCGFRRRDEMGSVLRELDVPELDAVRRRLEAGSEPAGTRAAFEALLALDEAERAATVAATTAACARHAAQGGRYGAECAMVLALASEYPGDVGVVCALLLNLVTLQAGEAVYLPAGNLHAYLEGVGVEIMASSDNVLRGGLTTKHVDRPELLQVLDFSPVEAAPLRPVPSGTESIYPTPAAEFRLSRLELTGNPCALRVTGPEILLVTEGAAVAASPLGRHSLRRGEAVFVPAASGQYSLEGTATVFRAVVPE